MAEESVVEVGICTFRRASVVDTLASLADVEAPAGVRLRVIVADNAREPEARERVLQAARTLGLDVAYVHAPERNICIARNAILDTAAGDWIGFLDDDETATRGWLAAMLGEAAAGWDAVLGPVKAIYPPETPAWMRAADLHSTAPVRSEGRILKGYAGNVLLRRAAIEARGLRFDPALGRQGGEDDDFFYRLTDAGGAIGYAAGALAYEPVPPARVSLRWLATRSFRTGQTHAQRLAARGGLLRRACDLGLASAKASACAAAAALHALKAERRNAWLVRGALHAGVVARLAGRRTLQLY